MLLFVSMNGCVLLALVSRVGSRHWANFGERETMRRKLALLAMGVLLAAALSLSGCGNGPKTEKGLARDLVENSSFYMAENAEMTDLGLFDNEPSAVA